MRGRGLQRLADSVYGVYHAFGHDAIGAGGTAEPQSSTATQGK